MEINLKMKYLANLFKKYIDILDLSIDESIVFFKENNQFNIAKKLQN